MRKWNHGDLVGLRVDTADSSEVRLLVGWSGGLKVTAHVSPEFIERLPTHDPHQALRDAVISAVGDMWTVYRGAARSNTPASGKFERSLAVASLFKEYEALTAAQTPPEPDPVEAFYDVAAGMLGVCSPTTWRLCRSKPAECACRSKIAVINGGTTP